MHRSALAAFAAAAAAACAQLPPTAQEQLAGRQVSYVCRDGKQFTAQFDGDAGYVRLTFADRPPALLRLQGSTDSLLRYSDGQMGFGTDGTRAVLADQVFITEPDCIAR
jgi:membrane-bound inhibitor of C-type lysozyme